MIDWRSASQSASRSASRTVCGAARHEQAPDAFVARGDAHRLEERVDADPAASAFDEHHAVRPLEVVAERSGPGEGALLLGAVEQLVDEVAAHAQLALGEAADPGELHREDGGAVLERHDVVLARRPSGVDEADHAERRRPAGARGR